MTRLARVSRTSDRGAFMAASVESQGASECLPLRGKARAVALEDDGHAPRVGGDAEITKGQGLRREEAGARTTVERSDRETAVRNLDVHVVLAAWTFEEQPTLVGPGDLACVEDASGVVGCTARRTPQGCVLGSRLHSAWPLGANDTPRAGRRDHRLLGPAARNSSYAGLSDSRTNG